MAPPWAVALLAAATLMAGCAQPEGLTTGPSCQWSAGPPGEIVRGFFSTSASDNERRDELGRGATENAGRPLVALTLRFHPYENPAGTVDEQGLRVLDGRVSVRFERGDDGSRLAAFRDNQRDLRQETWTFGPGEHANFTLTVDFEDGAQVRPTQVLAVWTFERDLDHNPETPSGATVRYDTVRWYRDCFS